MKDIEKQINLVVEERKAYDRGCAAKKISYQDWQDANNTLLSSLIETEQRVKDAETQLREMAVATFVETGEKQVAPGIGIREVTKYSYSENEALKWTIEHKMALMLDVTKFKSHVKADPPDFVLITTEPQATIATELKKVEGG